MSKSFQNTGLRQPRTASRCIIALFGRHVGLRGWLVHPNHRKIKNRPMFRNSQNFTPLSFVNGDGGAARGPGGETPPLMAALCDSRHGGTLICARSLQVVQTRLINALAPMDKRTMGGPGGVDGLLSRFRGMQSLTVTASSAYPCAVVRVAVQITMPVPDASPHEEEEADVLRFLKSG